MRLQAMFIDAAAAMLAAGVPVANVAGNVAQASAQTQQNTPTPKAMANTGATATRRMSFLSVDGSGIGFERPRYIKRPFHTVAQDKRDARKARNRQRNKR